MTITTATPPTPARSPEVPLRRRHWGRVAGPLAALAIGGVAVGRFLLAGEDTGGPASAPAGTDRTTTSLDGLRAATVARPDDPAAWRDYGTAALREAMRTGDPSYYGVAAQALASAGRLAPGDATILAARAILALSVHDFAAALPLATQAVAANPLSTPALAALVDAQIENGHDAEGEAALARLLAADPGVAAYARVSYVRQLTGDLEGAQMAMRQAVAAAGAGSERAVVETYLGDISLEMGRLADAGSAYDAALRDQPDSVLAGVGTARWLIASGRLVEAAALLDPLVARSPQPAVATLRGELALMVGDQAAADQAFALVEANSQILRSQGVVTDLESALFTADHGSPALALGEARAAYAARHTIFTADAMAWALVRNGRAGDAVAFVDEALAGGSTSPLLQVHAAAVFAAVGLVERARASLESAFRSLPWLTPSIRTVAADLARTLGVDVPAGWSR